MNNKVIAMPKEKSIEARQKENAINTLEMSNSVIAKVDGLLNKVDSCKSIAEKTSWLKEVDNYLMMGIKNPSVAINMLNGLKADHQSTIDRTTTYMRKNGWEVPNTPTISGGKAENHNATFGASDPRVTAEGSSVEKTTRFNPPIGLQGDVDYGKQGKPANHNATFGASDPRFTAEGSSVEKTTKFNPPIGLQGDVDYGKQGKPANHNAIVVPDSSVESYGSKAMREASSTSFPRDAGNEFASSGLKHQTGAEELRLLAQQAHEERQSHTYPAFGTSFKNFLKSLNPFSGTFPQAGTFISPLNRENLLTTPTSAPFTSAEPISDVKDPFNSLEVQQLRANVEDAGAKDTSWMKPGVAGDIKTLAQKAFAEEGQSHPYPALASFKGFLKSLNPFSGIWPQLHKGMSDGEQAKSLWRIITAKNEAEAKGIFAKPTFSPDGKPTASTDRRPQFGDSAIGWNEANNHDTITPFENTDMDTVAKANLHEQQTPLDLTFEKEGRLSDESTHQYINDCRAGKLDEASFWINKPMKATIKDNDLKSPGWQQSGGKEFEEIRESIYIASREAYAR
jgi:hypothetical protein